MLEPASSQNSLASRLASLPKPKLQSLLGQLSPEETELALYCWELWRRPSQAIPVGAWIVWLILAGRGFGKTRTGAETVREWAKSFNYVNLIGATADDARDIMIEGESGILAVCPNDERPIYKSSSRSLLWPNGSKSLIFTADEPERLRGKQHQKLWADELAAWRYAESWDQAMFGLRLGKNPQAVVTTTPRPNALVKALISDKTTHVTRGSTYDNQANLAPNFFSKIIAKYEGTRLGRQELNAEILDDNPGALWNHALIEAARVKDYPDIVRVVIAVDPAVSSNPDSDDVGIGVAGLGADGDVYVLADATVPDALVPVATPNEWGKRVVDTFDKWQADLIVAEVNQGGDLVESNVRAQRPYVPFKKIHAKRSKALRAEPVAALYEQGKVHHVGILPKLEDEMCEWNPQDPSAPSPNRVDWLVYAITELLPDVAIEQGKSRVGTANCIQSYTSPADFG
jgi:phage terminase large subunit-like protein